MDTIRDYDNKEVQFDVQGLGEADVASVYSGKDGRCCCGCSGNHAYASAHRVEASASRGYEVRDEEVSDVAVRNVLARIKRATQNDPANVKLYVGSHVAAVVGKRLYIAYLTKARIAEG